MEEFFTPLETTKKIEGKEGIWMTYHYEDGSVMEEGYKEYGQREGEWTSYHITGGLWIKQDWVKGINHGKYVEYNRDGSVKREMVIDMSEEVEKKKMKENNE